MKRAWFQIHLSTAIIIQFIAAVFVLANVLPYPPGYFLDHFFPPLFYDGDLPGMQGWPATFRIYGTSIVVEKWFWSDLLLNVLTGCAVLITCAYPIEWWIRRAEKRSAEDASKIR